MKIKQYLYQSIEQHDFLDSIIAFDRINMNSILADAEVDFNEVKRRNFFKQDERFIVAYDEADHIMGYIEYGPSDSNAKHIYITSMQIQNSNRKSVLASELLSRAFLDVKNNKFEKMHFHVFKSNVEAVALFSRVGFTMDSIEGNNKQYLATADVDRVDSGFFKRICSRYGKDFVE